MTIKVFDKPVTANQFAKWMLYDKTEAAFYFSDYDADGMTEREKAEVYKCLEKHSDRIRKYLGIAKIIEGS